MQFSGESPYIRSYHLIKFSTVTHVWEKRACKEAGTPPPWGRGLSAIHFWRYSLVSSYAHTQSDVERSQSAW